MCFDICTINIRVSIRVRGFHLVFFLNFLVCHCVTCQIVHGSGQFLQNLSIQMPCPAHPALSPRKAGLKEQGYSMLANKWGPWDRGTVLGSAHRFEHVSDQAQLQGVGVAVLAL